MRRSPLLLTFGALVLGGGTFGCGGAPDSDEFVGVTALCNDGTIATSQDEDGCDFHGGTDQTYIGGPPATKP